MDNRPTTEQLHVRPLAHRCWLVGGLIGLGIAQLSAQTTIAVVNHSFETGGAIAYNEFTFGAPEGWSLYDPSNIASAGTGPTFYVGTLTPQPDGEGDFINFPNGAADGARVAIVFNYVGSHGTAYGLVQMLAATLQAQTTYTLHVDIGNIASGIALDNTPYNLDGFPGYRVDLLAGNTVLASDNNTLAGSILDGTFGLSVVQFTTGASDESLIGQQLGIRLVSLNQFDPAAPTADLEVDFDNVRLTATAIPEPAASAWFALIACVGALLLRRRSAANA